MIYSEKGIAKMEDGEPAFRTCWECNPAHERLKKVNTVHVCFSCGRYWIFDRYLDTIETEEEFDAYFSGELGLKIGESTTKIDGGYRVTVYEIKPEASKE